MNCAHGPCTCSEATVERNGQRHCNNACANASGDANCQCDHAGCGGRA